MSFAIEKYSYANNDNATSWTHLGSGLLLVSDGRLSVVVGGQVVQQLNMGGEIMAILKLPSIGVKAVLHGYQLRFQMKFSDNLAFQMARDALRNGGCTMRDAAGMSRPSSNVPPYPSPHSSLEVSDFLTQPQAPQSTNSRSLTSTQQLPAPDPRLSTTFPTSTNVVHSTMPLNVESLIIECLSDDAFISLVSCCTSTYTRSNVFLTSGNGMASGERLEHE